MRNPELAKMIRVMVESKVVLAAYNKDLIQAAIELEKLEKIYELIDTGYDPGVYYSMIEILGDAP